LFTWSNERDNPALERLDRAFASVHWMEQHQNHMLHCLSSDSSDHAPLLLIQHSEPWGKPRFRFEVIWTKFDGFVDVVRQAWQTQLPGASTCRTLDFKLCAVAKALKSWSAKHVRSIRFQLAAARAVLFEFDVAQETRQLSQEELDLHRELKVNILGLASLPSERSVARQRARVRYLREGDENTRFFHLQACHCRRKHYLVTIQHDGQTFSEEDAKADIVFYYNDILGKPFLRQHRVHLGQLQLPRLDLSDQVEPFSVEEITTIIKEIPSDRAPGPDGLMVASIRQPGKPSRSMPSLCSWCYGT
jgi:hypothetical protein